MERKELTMDDVYKMAMDKMDEIPHHRVYFSMREMKLRWISSETVDTIKCCIALEELGIPITTPMITLMRQKDGGVVRNSLHTLGDKQVLTMMRGSKFRVQRWILSPLFREIYYSGKRLTDLTPEEKDTSS